jgi:spore germination cell wall hydrolase CwlJ-like protein
LVKNLLRHVTPANCPAKIAAHWLEKSIAISGERAVLTRSIDLDDPFDLSIEEKLFLAAKRTCVGFAMVALTISGLDLMNIRPLESAAEFVNRHRHARLAEWPGLIRDGIHQISIVPPASVVVEIPADALAMEPLPALSPPKVVAAEADTPVAELAKARREDAVQLAMAAPPVLPQATLGDLAQRAQDLAREARAMATPQDTPASAPAQLEAPAPATMQLASVDPGALPQAAAPEPAAITISLPTHLAVLPPPAPGVPPPSPAQRLHLEGAARAKAERCLANAIYFEARDQPYRGQVAVAQVVMNRVFSGVYPRDVCGVIYQNASHRLACQFTFACDGKRKTINEFGAWGRARRIARETLDGQLYVQAVGTATHYHATYVHPGWVHEMHRMAREGIHLFYRPWAWGSGANEPIWSREQLASYKRLAANKQLAADSRRR